jgi:hypothetical protein
LQHDSRGAAHRLPPMLSIFLLSGKHGEPHLTPTQLHTRKLNKSLLTLFAAELTSDRH